METIYRLIGKYIIPKEVYLKYKFKKTFGFPLNLSNPRTFNEKLQWKKLYDHNPLYTSCSDKYAVREYVKQKIGEKYLISLQYVTDKPETIPFDKLKIPFIIKSNHGSSRNILIYKKEEINKEKIKKNCSKWLKENYYYYEKEWQYKNINPRIIIEKMLLNDKNEVPEDYKFHCFNGKVEFIQVDTGRFSNHKRTIFNKEWSKLPFRYCLKLNNKPAYGEDNNIKKPINLSEMILIAKKLSEGFTYVRVDLYSLNNKIYFGELTFTHFGLSGPIILTLSRQIVEHLNNKENVQVIIDLKPALDDQKLDKRLLRDIDSFAKKEIKHIFRSWLPTAIIPSFLEMLDLNENMSVNEITAKKRKEIRLLMKNWKWNKSVLG